MTRTKRVNRALSLLPALCMVPVLLPVTAAAAPGEMNQSFTVTNSANVFIVTRSKDASAAETVRYRTVSPGLYNAGNTFYVSVPFAEIVIGNPTLNTTWGDAACFDGGGTNVLTFRGTVHADTVIPFSVTGFSGTRKRTWQYRRMDAVHRPARFCLQFHFVFVLF